MKNINMELKYGAYPLWIVDEEGMIVDNVEAEEIGLDKKISMEIELLQEMYDSLFKDNEFEFKYIDDDKNRLNEIKNKYVEISKYIINKLNKEKYNVKIISLNL